MTDFEVHPLGTAERLKALEEHLAEQVQFVRNRIADGVEAGAKVWRLALEDIIHDDTVMLAAVVQPAGHA